ncbi:MAG: hypothetical protein ABWY01_04045, partial [Pseudoxanthomonas sp.]
MRSAIAIGAVAASLLALASTPAAAIEAFTADYQATAMGMQGNGQMSISPQGNNRWQYSLTISNSLVDMSQKTVFDEKDGVLRPLSSSDLSRLLVKKKVPKLIRSSGVPTQLVTSQLPCVPAYSKRVPS